jgi:hypothetical protein
MFIHLTPHSAYSLQEGLPLPSELAQAAQAAGMPALGLTSHRLPDEPHPPDTGGTHTPAGIEDAYNRWKSGKSEGLYNEQEEE